MPYGQTIISSYCTNHVHTSHCILGIQTPFSRHTFSGSHPPPVPQVLWCMHHYHPGQLSESANLYTCHMMIYNCSILNSILFIIIYRHLKICFGRLYRSDVSIGWIPKLIVYKFCMPNGIHYIVDGSGGICTGVPMHGLYRCVTLHGHNIITPQHSSVLASSHRSKQINTILARASSLISHSIYIQHHQTQSIKSMID